MRLNGGITHVLIIDNVTLDNQHLTSAGTWAGTPGTETAVPTANGYRLSLPGYSAALLTAQLRPGQ